MAKTPKNDAHAPTEAPEEVPTPPEADQPQAKTYDEGEIVNPAPVTTTNNSGKNENVKPERVTLVKGDHKVTTSHPVEINNYRARGYQIEK